MIKQYRYFGEVNENSETVKSNVTKERLKGGSTEAALCPGNLTKLGIQTLPGVMFTVTQDNEYIIIGMSGIFELDLTNSITTINYLAIHPNSLNMIDNNPGGYIIIDMEYE